jgi:hypothetical protein
MVKRCLGVVSFEGSHMAPEGDLIRRAGAEEEVTALTRAAGRRIVGP